LGVALGFSIWLYWTGFVVLIGANSMQNFYRKREGATANEGKRQAEPNLAA
jgi:uncharacterized BrkB/YihY/UPF0761 family membrane protein